MHVGVGSAALNSVNSSRSPDQEKPALEHRGLGDHVVIAGLDGLGDGPGGVPDLEAEIPQRR